MNYDLFAYLRDEILTKFQKDNLRAFEQRLQTYKKTRNMASILTTALGISPSPGMAWQIAESIHPVVCSLAHQKADELNDQIDDLEQKKKRAKNTNPKKQIDQQIKRLRRLIRELISVNDIKPVWGIASSNDFSVLSQYTQDNDLIRQKEACNLPPLCFRIKLSVPMKTPIIIKGDRPFVANENPFCTDKVTGWPLLLPSTLKGQARHAVDFQIT